MEVCVHVGMYVLTKLGLDVLKEMSPHSRIQFQTSLRCAVAWYLREFLTHSSLHYNTWVNLHLGCDMQRYLQERYTQGGSRGRRRGGGEVTERPRAACQDGNGDDAQVRMRHKACGCFGGSGPLGGVSHLQGTPPLQDAPPAAWGATQPRPTGEHCP